MKIAAFLAALLLWADAAHGVSWTNISAPFRLIGGNYCDIAGRKCHDSNNGRQSAGDGNFYINGSLAMSRAQMGGYARTIAVDPGGSKSLLHIGTGYPTRNGYRPHYAVRSGSKWRMVGPIRINGATNPYIFSSSMAYLYRGGKHYMVQDAGAYGRGAMAAFESTDGRNYRPIGGDIARLTQDSGPAFPDLAYHGGRYHLVYVGPTWQSCSVRHLSAARMSGPWRVESTRAMTACKSVNLYTHNGSLHAYSNGRHWRMGGAQQTAAAPAAPVASGGDCGRPDVRVSGKRASITWGGGRCFVKMFQGRSRVLSQSDNDGQHVQMLATGSYRVGVRSQAGGRYQWRAFRVR